jgi:hypothetical protein
VVQPPPSQSFAEFEERTKFQQKNPSHFELIQTSWPHSAPTVLAGKLELTPYFESRSNPKQARSAELPPKLRPSPSNPSLEAKPQLERQAA